MAAPHSLTKRGIQLLPRFFYLSDSGMSVGMHDQEESCNSSFLYELPKHYTLYRVLFIYCFYTGSIE